MNEPTYVSLFAGAGGFDLGFDAAGFRCAAQVEIDRTARDVLGRHWPDVPRFPDVCDFGKAQVKRCEVVVGGFPCQDVSVAGKRAGFAGERSSLFFEMARVVRELRPDYVVWENVPGLLTSDEGRDFLAVLVELDRLGFDGGWRTVDAQFFGVPQQRRRVFGVFARRCLGAGRAAEILALTEGVRRRTPPRRKKGQGVAATLTRGSGSRGVNPPGRRQEDDINIIVGILQTTGRESGYRCGADEAGAGHLVVFGGGDTRGERGGNATLSAKGGVGRQDFDTENFVLIGSGQCHGTNVGPVGVLRAGNGNETGGVPFVAFSCGLGGKSVRHALTAKPYAGEDGTGRGTPLVAFNWQSGGDCRLNPGHLTDAQSVGQVPAVSDGYFVRRLTPRECERLMGWPDDHTRFRADGREIADGPRYRLTGNGVVATVSGWLSRRLMAVMRGGVA